MRLSDDNCELIRLGWSLLPFAAFSHSLCHQFEFSSPGKKRKSWAAEGLLKALGASRLRSDW
ncbi:MAG: hypothetical protein WCD39_04410, partial [Methyloceanibacter sp.]